jgi:hypothetical protein
VIATLTFEVRLALPVSELFQLFLERHPTEKRHIEEISTRRALETAAIYEEGAIVLPIHTHNGIFFLNMYIGGGMATAAVSDAVGVPASSPAEDEVRLYNELEVIIHKVVRTYIHT